MRWDATLDFSKAEKLSRAYAEEHDCDVIAILGDLYPETFDALCAFSRLRNERRTNVMVYLSTFGGNPHQAYKIGRYLQSHYKEITIVVPDVCKSAGTLLAIAAHHLVIDDAGELGPIDIQQPKQDEWDSVSGLVENAGTVSLEDIASRLFTRLVTEIRNLRHVTFKTAADTAAHIVGNALTPVYAQIDPLRLGDTARSLRISKDYAERLSEKSDNFKDRQRADTLDRLVSGYSSHSFVIDREEARALFKSVHEPSKEINAIRYLLGPFRAYDTIASAIFLNVPAPAPEEEPENEETEKAVDPAALPPGEVPPASGAKPKKNDST